MVLGAEAYALRQAVAGRVAGTPYEMVETEDGFDLRIRITEPQWSTVLRRTHRRGLLQHRVTLDEARKKYTVHDDLYEVRWHARPDDEGGGEVPRLLLQGDRRRTTGRVREVSGTWTLKDGKLTARPVEEGGGAFDSADGPAMIREPAKALGWSERWNDAMRIGFVAGLVGSIGSVLTVGLLAWAALTGRFG